jgi:hypothetical protein
MSAVAVCASPPAETSRLSRSDKAFLKDLEKRAFRYFWEMTDPNTGMTRGRARADGVRYEATRRDIGSIAVTGFGLTALCIGADNGWVKRGEARTRVRNAMRFFLETAPQEHGWFFHWMNVINGERTGVTQDSATKSELSSIDTALLMGGVLTARQYFHDDAEIVRMATQIYRRMDFQWMLNGDPLVLSHGWRPETGFLAARWNRYSEFTIIYVLGIGSPTYAIKPESWYAWERPEVSYAGYTWFGTSPLFTHQYSHAWVDYRDRRESKAPHADFFANSVAATRAHRAFCIDLAKEFPGYSEDIWGITASNSAHGYAVWGGWPSRTKIDGTVVPAAAGGSLMFTPDIALPALRAMRNRFGSKIWGRYGFTDAFNPNDGWVSPDLLGLDVGITLLSAENLRTGKVWKWFMANAEISRALELIGLEKYR